MTDALTKVEVIQRAGEITLRLLEIDLPPAVYGCSEDVFCQFHVDYGANGTGAIVVEFRTNEGWHTAIDHNPSELTPIDVGRYVARAEISILADELEPPTETLDYWIIDSSDYHDAEFSQSRWANVRSVSRQTVNGRIQLAQETLTDEE